MTFQGQEYCKVRRQRREYLQHTTERVEDTLTPRGTPKRWKQRARCLNMDVAIV